jgi:hypothetical protein
MLHGGWEMKEKRRRRLTRLVQKDFLIFLRKCGSHSGGCTTNKKWHLKKY